MKRSGVLELKNKTSGEAEDFSGSCSVHGMLQRYTTGGVRIMSHHRPLFIIPFVLVLLSVSIGCAHQDSVVALAAPESLAGESSSFITIDDITIHWESAGTEHSTTPLVLLHGFAANTGSWMYLMPSLSESYPVYAYDRIPFGLSERYLAEDFDRDTSPYRSEAVVERGLALLDAWGIEEAVLVGSSAGGAVALQMALADPDRVKALVLIDPAVYGGGPPGVVRALLWLPCIENLVLNQVKKLGDEPQKNLENSWFDAESYPNELLEVYTRALKVKNWDRALLEFTRASEKSDLKDRLNEVSQRVLLIHGREDSIIDVKESIRLAQELPQVEFHIIEESGHLPHEERPQETSELIVEFLDSLNE